MHLKESERYYLWAATAIKWAFLFVAAACVYFIIQMGRQPAPTPPTDTVIAPPAEPPQRE